MIPMLVKYPRMSITMSGIVVDVAVATSDTNINDTKQAGHRLCNDNLYTSNTNCQTTYHVHYMYTNYWQIIIYYKQNMYICIT